MADGPFDHHDLAALNEGAAQVPGFVPGSTGLIVAPLGGTSGITGTGGGDGADLVRGPGDVFGAWPV
ncbi:hypothetical protein ACFXKG_31315 [Streptomyces sp. NPDC059255]|uniref:hypothetical protein n=1 Tax=Streptomyces sp. NPDC059255 TaxID=3346793 RepID=UPI0036AA2606